MVILQNFVWINGVVQSANQINTLQKIVLKIFSLLRFNKKFAQNAFNQDISQGNAKIIQNVFNVNNMGTKKRTVQIFKINFLCKTENMI